MHGKMSASYRSPSSARSLLPARPALTPGLTLCWQRGFVTLWCSWAGRNPGAAGLVPGHGSCSWKHSQEELSIHRSRCWEPRHGQQRETPPHDSSGLI